MSKEYLNWNQNQIQRRDYLCLLRKFTDTFRRPWGRTCSREICKQDSQQSTTWIGHLGRWQQGRWIIPRRNTNVRMRKSVPTGWSEQPVGWSGANQRKSGWNFQTLTGSHGEAFTTRSRGCWRSPVSCRSNRISWRAMESGFRVWRRSFPWRCAPPPCSSSVGRTGCLGNLGAAPFPWPTVRGPGSLASERALWPDVIPELRQTCTLAEGIPKPLVLSLFCSWKTMKLKRREKTKSKWLCKKKKKSNWRLWNYWQM